MTDIQNVVLVHGGFVDGSGWRGVYDLLTADGFNVSVVQNQTLSLESDVETTTNMLDLQDGPAILVGHSYGGAVITEAGTHDSVAGLVYIAAFAPDQGESVSSLLAHLPPDGPVPPILPPQDGFLFLDREKFAYSFAADVPARVAAFMADSQVPWGVEALNGAVTEPAWRSKPSWYLITTDDQMIPPPLQRTMAERAGTTTTEVSGSHAIYVSQPDAVASLIMQAARSPRAASVARTGATHMNIVVFGATGMIGTRIAAELKQRGHAVTAATRATGADVTDSPSIASVAAGADAVVSAVSARGMSYTLADVAPALVEGVREAGVRRLLVVGGAGSLEVAPDKRLVDSPDFPEEWKPEAIAHTKALDYYRTVEDLDWTFVSPAAFIHPGERTGRYRLGGDQLLVDDNGNSEVSAEDYAIAIADLLETGGRQRERITVAW